jgi:hypothetical protein
MVIAMLSAISMMMVLRMWFPGAGAGSGDGTPSEGVGCTVGAGAGAVRSWQSKVLVRLYGVHAWAGSPWAAAASQTLLGVVKAPV